MKHMLRSLLYLSFSFFITNISVSAQNTFPATGSVGIGTTTPGTLLTIKTTGTGGFGLEHTSGIVSIKTYLNTAIGQIGTYSNHPFQLMANNGLNQFVLLPGGNIGIGNAAPAAKLDVNGDALINGITIGRGKGNQLYNTVVGAGALNSNTTGNNNVVVGSNALYKNLAGYSNVAIGVKALYNNTGSNLVAIGDSALFNNLIIQDYSGDGTKNTAIGSKTLFANTEGAYNTAVGYNALYGNTLGSQNTAIGTEALYSQNSVPNSSNYVTGNVAVGYQALYKANAGAVQEDSGIENTAVGTRALNTSTTGYSNTVSGFNSFFFSTTGSNNTSSGALAGYNATTGSQNTLIGSNSGFTLTKGSGNTLVGCFTNVNSNSLNNTTALGNGAMVSASNTVRIGNNAVTSIGGYVSWTNVSDGRVKKNIKENVPGLVFINKLKAVTYNLDLEAADRILQSASLHNNSGKETTPAQAELADRKAKESAVYTGFIAQDVEKAAKDIKYDFSGVDAAKNQKDLYGLRYAEFVVPLVKAVQELSAKNDTLQQTNSTLQTQINNQQKQLDALAQLVNSLQQKQETGSNNQQSAGSLPALSAVVSSATLAQNIPNPFANVTTIPYTLPANYTVAKLVISDKNGIMLKTINLSGSGKGTIQVDATSLAAGAYQYSLYINNSLVASRQMILQGK